MSLSISTRQAYTEIDEFLGLLTEKERNEIPLKLRNFFKKEKDKEYVKNISSDIPIEDQNLKEETLAIIALLNLKYWCKDEEEKARLRAIYDKNDKEYQEELHKKYETNNIFKKKEETIAETEEEINKENNNREMIEYKESFFKKIINFIKNIFK